MCYKMWYLNGIGYVMCQDTDGVETPREFDFIVAALKLGLDKETFTDILHVNTVVKTNTENDWLV